MGTELANGHLSPTPSPLRDGSGLVGWQTRRCSHNSPPSSTETPAALTVPTDGETAEAERSGPGSASTPPAQPGRVPASPRGFPKAVQSWQACGDSLEPGRQHRGCFPTVSNSGSAHSPPRCHRPRGPIRMTRR